MYLSMIFIVYWILVLISERDKFKHGNSTEDCFKKIHKLLLLVCKISFQRFLWIPFRSHASQKEGRFESSNLRTSFLLRD